MSRGTVQRMRYPEGVGLPFIEHRTRDLQQLLSETEWGWSRDPHEAYVFESYGIPDFPSKQTPEFSAEIHVQELITAGERSRIWHCTFGADQQQKRVQRRAEVENKALRSVREAGLRVAPEEAYEVTRRHLGEKD